MEYLSENTMGMLGCELYGLGSFFCN